MARETIHTENGYNFTDRGIRGLLDEADFENSMMFEKDLWSIGLHRLRAWRACDAKP